MPEQKTSSQQRNYEIVIVGAGRVGIAIARLLESSDLYNTCLVCPSFEQVRNAKNAGFNAIEASGTDEQVMEKLLQNADAVILAAPESIAERVAEIALKHDCHYFDLCENFEIAQKIRKLAEGANRAFVSQCGLAPGYVSALAYEKSKTVSKAADITVYVGVLPKIKTNRLGFGNMWSITGLVSEYTKPCKALQAGKTISLPPLTEYETLNIEGEKYEAFTTAGSLDGVIPDLESKLSSLVFKTLRYRGHLDYIEFLLDDLGYKDRLYAFPNLLMNGLKPIREDKAIVSVQTVNPDPSKPDNSSFTQIFHSRTESDGSTTSAISIVSAAHICSVLDVICSKMIAGSGPLDQSQLPLAMLAKSKFSSDLKLNI